MKILLSWLREYVETDLDPVVIADHLTRLGLTVESIDEVGRPVEGVVVARVLRTERHAEAERVQRVYVDAGDGTERHVWCGAFNMSAGDLVPLATIGTTMPDGRRIERRGILGIDSEGMLCSAVELGVGDDAGGILILPERSPLGASYHESLGIESDVVFDLDLTRNRPDAWGYLGVARDLAAALGVELKLPAVVPIPSAPERSIPVEIISGDRCGRFTATALSGVRVAPSAEWMARRLSAAGMRPINNVVDVSNYVMLELNQPNHAYDLERLGGGGFNIRTASPGEEIVTLDAERRVLDGDDLLICDALDAPIGIAGIMGGFDSEITEATTTVALEMAWFEPLGIMTSVTRLGLRSEASARNERGIDPFGIDFARDRFMTLLAETCPDLVWHRPATDTRAESLPAEMRSTVVRISQVNRLLGTSLASQEVCDLLEPIGFSAVVVDDGRLSVTLPSWRPDCVDEIDVVEEVARHYGYDQIGRAVPRPATSGGLTSSQQRRRVVRDVLIGLGISEAMPNPFLAPDTAVRAGLDAAAVRITNPLVSEESVLRNSLRPGLLGAVAYNASHRRFGVRLFEIGRVYPPADAELPAEYEALGVVLAGQEATAAVEVWREIAVALGVGARIDQSRVPGGLHPTRSASLVAGRDVVGALGEVDPEVAAAFGIDERVAIVELDLGSLLAAEVRDAVMKPVGRAPSSDLDLAFELDDEVPAERLDKAIRQGAGALLADLELFDVYRGEAVGETARSLAYRLRLQAGDQTLTDRDIAEVRERCVAAAEKLGAVLRG